MHSSALSKGRPRAAPAPEGTTSAKPELGCASPRRDGLAGHMDDLDGCKKSLRERREDDLDDLDELLSRLHTLALQAPLLGSRTPHLRIR